MLSQLQSTDIILLSSKSGRLTVPSSGAFRFLNVIVFAHGGNYHCASLLRQARLSLLNNFSPIAAVPTA